MDTESKQNSGFAADMQSSSLKEKIQKLLANKLTPMQISEGYLHSKELTYLLGCSERTLIRWSNCVNKEMSMSVFPVLVLPGHINIFLMTFTNILLITQFKRSARLEMQAFFITINFPVNEKRSF